MSRKIALTLLGILLILSACSPKAANNQAPAKPLKIAVLPIIDTLPMYVAQQEGLFARHGVNVEFIPVAFRARARSIAGRRRSGWHDQ